MDCKSLQEKIAADCKRTEDDVMSTWLPQIIHLFRSEETLSRVKEKKLDSFFRSASMLISNQVGSCWPHVGISKIIRLSRDNKDNGLLSFLPS